MAFRPTQPQFTVTKDLERETSVQEFHVVYLNILFAFLTFLDMNLLGVTADFSEDVPTMLVLRDALDPYNLSIGRLWTEYSNCTAWEGVYCSENNGRVTEIILPYKELQGSIPYIIMNLTNLQILDLHSNLLSGPIPDSIGNLSNLGYLFLQGNSLSGSIPDSIGNVSKLDYFYSHGISLSGSIPDSIGNLSSLSRLVLHSNSLSGSIPYSIGSLTHLIGLTLSSNTLSGSIPDSFVNLSNLIFLDVSSNFFTSGVPYFNRSSFVYLDFSTNCFDSSVDSSQRNITECESFCNAYQPGGPCGGKGTCFAAYLGAKAECNCLEGYSLYFDPHNCVTKSPPAPPPPAPPPPPTTSTISTWVLAVIIIIPIMLIIVTGMLLWCLISHYVPRQSSFDKRFRAKFMKSIPLHVLSVATNNFSEDNLIGVGGFGKVYKGVTTDGEVWAVKRATDITPENAIDFQHEVNVISTIFHRSILPLKGYCNENGELILVYAFMVNGSLRDFMHKSESSAAPLTFEQRMNIAVGAAEGLHYLHHQARPTVIHGNVKSHNILLDENFNAHVADFGFLKERVQVVGTPEYNDAEYVQSNKATIESDVYSFGVVLLELITGLHAVFIEEDEDSTLNNTKSSLVTYVHEKLQWDVSKMMDPKLNGQFDSTRAKDFIALAEKCLSKFAENRPSMQDVCATLVNINSSYGGKEMGGDEVGEKMEHMSVEIIDGMGWAQTFLIPSNPRSFMRLK